jgi:hypothetical protein
VPGQSCWDLNGNYQPDPEEDRNGDGRVSVIDCQGAPGAAAVAPPQASGPSVLLPVTGNTTGLDLLPLANRSGNDGEAYKVVDVACPANRRVMSGGALIESSTPNDVRMAIQSQFLIAPNVYRVVAVRNSPDTSGVWSVTGWVLCY